MKLGQFIEHNRTFGQLRETFFLKNFPEIMRKMWWGK